MSVANETKPLEEIRDSTWFRPAVACILHAGAYVVVTYLITLQAYDPQGWTNPDDALDAVMRTAHPFIAWLLGGLLAWLVSWRKMEKLLPLFAGTFAAMTLVPNWLPSRMTSGDHTWLIVLPVLVISTLPVLLVFSSLSRTRWFRVTVTVLAVVGLVLFIAFPGYASWARMLTS